MNLFHFFHTKTPAVGVQKQDERASVQTNFSGFFVMLGRKFWNLSNLNLLMAVYVLFCALGIWLLSPYPVAFYIFLFVSILLFGIFSAGSSYITRGYVRGDPVYILSDFRYAVKNNWRQAILLGFIDVFILFLLVFDIFCWSGMDFGYLAELPSENVVTEQTLESEESTALTEDAAVQTVQTVQTAEQSQEPQIINPFDNFPPFIKGVFFYVCIFLLFLYACMRCYMYIIMVTFKLSIPKILKNSFIFSVLGIKRNILALLGIAIVGFINMYIFVWVPMIGILLPLIISLSLCSFIGAYAAYPVIKKYMITPYYKDEEVYEEYDRIFEDRG